MRQASDRVERLRPPRFLNGIDSETPDQLDLVRLPVREVAVLIVADRYFKRWQAAASLLSAASIPT